MTAADPIPAGTSYVAGSTSSGVAFTGDPTTTINLTNPIAVGQTVTVTYQVTVNTLPTPNPIDKQGEWKEIKKPGKHTSNAKPNP